MQKKHIATGFLLLLAAIALCFSYVIAQPFLIPMFLAVMIAVVFYPAHEWVAARIRNRNVAAVVSTLLVGIAFAVPCSLLGTMIFREVTALYRSLIGGEWNPVLSQATERALGWAGQYVDVSTLNIQETLMQWLQDTSRELLVFGAHAVTNVIRLIAGVAITLFSVFFLFRDGVFVREQLKALLPLAASQSDRLFRGISNSIIANVHGCFAVGATQGILTGLAFWAVGLHSPVLWGTVTSMCSMIPIVGSAMVWGPGVIALLLGGHWVKALLLLIWCAVVIAQADNVIRPYIISQRAKMHPLLVFFALLGGLRAFGPIGIFVGPVVLSTTLAVLEMLKEINMSYQDSNAMPECVDTTADGAANT